VEDEELMREVHEGDVAQLEALFERHHAGVLRYFCHVTSNRGLSDDLAQEVFFRVLKYRHTYVPPARFRPWLWQIARNVYADHLRRQKPEVAMPDGAVQIPSGAVATDRALEKKQHVQLLHRALAAMPEEKREVLVMSRLLGWKHEDIAAVLQCEVNTVKARVYRALRDLSGRFLSLSRERAS
jgi:RNA polymerase sigma-70 factor (ECF subfamily)